MLSTEKFSKKPVEMQEMVMNCRKINFHGKETHLYLHIRIVLVFALLHNDHVFKQPDPINVLTDTA